jgi:hypothetical protein
VQLVASSSKPRNRAAADVVAAGDVRKGLTVNVATAKDESGRRRAVCNSAANRSSPCTRSVRRSPGGVRLAAAAPQGLGWVPTTGDTEDGDGDGVDDRDRGLGQKMGTAEGRADWLEPEADVIPLLPELKARGVRTALDLGCGVGRHALDLAEHGLAVEAIDGSAAGLAVVRETARARGISLGVRQGTADAVPFDDGSFDFVRRGM